MFMPSREQMLQQCPPMEASCWVKPNNNVEIAPNCPRCASSNTKFCYYNNYSFSQPRYFCKGCRRYWTKGGSLRNVPVGGGCRKNRRSRSSKPLSNSYQKTMSSGGSSDNTPLDDVNSGPDIDLAEVFSKFLNYDSSCNKGDSCSDSVDSNSGQENVVLVVESQTFEDLSPAFETEKIRVEVEGADDFTMETQGRNDVWPRDHQLVQEEVLWCDDVGPVSPWNSSMWQPMVHLQELETMHIDDDQWGASNCFDIAGYEVFSRP